MMNTEAKYNLKKLVLKEISLTEGLFIKVLSAPLPIIRFYI